MIQSLLGLGVFGMLLIAFIWWLPVILIARSDKTHGGEKLVWIALIFFFSWFSWILYALLAPISSKEV